MTAYYNEFDAGAAAWLRELIKEGLIAPGDVDERSVVDVTASDLVGYAQCHFFAGIGGWSLALRTAGVTDDIPVWTASLPCQPFSNMGKKKGKEDERHLWPVFAELVREQRPAVLFGEQVASPDGRAWLSDVRVHLEGLGYGVGAADLCAAGVGAPHIRQRLFWGAIRLAEGEVGQQRARDAAGDGRAARRLDHPDGQGLEGRRANRRGASQRDPQQASVAAWGTAGWVSCADGLERPLGPASRGMDDGVSSHMVRLRGYGNAIVPEVGSTFVTSFLEAVAVSNIHVDVE